MTQGLLERTNESKSSFEPAAAKTCDVTLIADSFTYERGDEGKPTIILFLFFFFFTKKNKKNTTERLELKKYNPILKKVTVHKEIK